MSAEKMPKELFNLWKSSVQAYMKNLSAMQEQGDRMLELMLEQSDVYREEFKKMLKESADQVKQMQKSYLDAIQENMQKMEEMLDSKK